MSISVDWLDTDQSVLCYTMSATWSWKDFDAAIEQSLVLLEREQTPIILLIDLRASQHTPPINGVHLAKVAHAPTLNHPNANHIAVWGAKHFAKTIFEVFSRLYPQAAARYRFIDHLDELNTLFQRNSLANPPIP